MDLTHAVLTDHAAEQLRVRQIAPELVREVLAGPDSVLPVRSGRVVAQAVRGGFLIRVFVDVDREPAEVVTVYRTTKINKYRSQP